MFEPMRMGRVLGAVAAALVFFLLVLAAAVYFTRDEDNIQADNLLAENLSKAVALAHEDSDNRVDLRDLARFEWDRALLVASGTSNEQISQKLGHEWTGIDTVDGGDLLIFLKDGKVTRFADYRGRGEFTGFSRPFADLPETLKVDPVTLAIRAGKAG
jgi:hypothetical protein